MRDSITTLSPSFSPFPPPPKAQERYDYVINPTECAERIVLNDADLAKELFDLLLWAADQPDLKDNGDYDEIMGNLYKRLQSCRDAREAYAQSRLQRADSHVAESVVARSN